MSELVHWDAIRVLNLIAALTALAGMVWRRPFFIQQDPTVRLLLSVLAVLLLTSAYASVEVLATPSHESGGPRLLAVLAAMVLTNAALLRARPARLRPPPRPPEV